MPGSEAAVNGKYGTAVRRREDPPLIQGTGTYTDDVAAPGALHAHFVRSEVERAADRLHRHRRGGRRGRSGRRLHRRRPRPRALPARPDGSRRHAAPDAGAPDRPLRGRGDRVGGGRDPRTGPGCRRGRGARLRATRRGDRRGGRGRRRRSAAVARARHERGRGVLGPPRIHSPVRTWWSEGASSTSGWPPCRWRPTASRWSPGPTGSSRGALGSPRKCLSTCVRTSRTRWAWTRPRCARSRPTSAAGSARAAVYRSTAVARAAQLLGARCAGSRRAARACVITHGRAQVQHVELGAKRDGTLVGIRVDLLADMGAYPIGAFMPTDTGDAVGRLSVSRHRVPRPKRRDERDADRAVPGRGPSRGDGAGRARDGPAGVRACDGSRRTAAQEPHPVRRVPVQDGHGHHLRRRRLRDRDERGPAHRRLRGASRRAGRTPRTRRPADDRDRPVQLRGDHVVLVQGVRPSVEVAWAAPSRCLPARRLTARATRPPSPRSCPRRWACRWRPSRSCTPTPDTSPAAPARGIAVTAGGRVLRLRARATVLDMARRLAAHLLEVDPRDLAPFADGRIEVRGAPDRSLTWAELAAAAGDPPAPRRHGQGTGCLGRISRDGLHFPVRHPRLGGGGRRGDRAVELIRHVSVDDCGRILNPVLFAARFTAASRRASRRRSTKRSSTRGRQPRHEQPRRTRCRRRPNFPRSRPRTRETPTPLNPLGAKGIGESGSIGSTPAVQNAAVDALAPLGVRHLEMPATPLRVWEAIEAARSGASVA